VSDAHLIKLDRQAFSRGVDDLITLRPLRQIVGSVFGDRKTVVKRGTVVKIDNDTTIDIDAVRYGRKQRSDAKK
jgi:hypothetical protein